MLNNNIDIWAEKLNIAKKDIPDPEDSFSGGLKFGTSGLRGVMGIGTNRMNEFVIARASKGLALKVAEDGGNSIAVSYDSRLNSESFARTAAEVFAACGLKVYITRELSITPLLAYAVRKLNCGAGVMVTASHNPKEYNGYKVYGGSGCQISGGYAKAVADKMSALDYFNIKRADFDTEVNKGNICYFPPYIYSDYISEVKKQGFNGCKGLKVCYTPLNGGGGAFVPALLKTLGAEVVDVPEQMRPDGNFPTCPYPNPEMPEALALAKKYAEENACDIIIANDPDTDRIGCAYREGGGYGFLSGDEIGLLICNYLLEEMSAVKDIKGAVIVRTVVTMRLIDKIAADYGVRVTETLTGFKNICAEALKLDRKGEGQKFIAGYEESNGIAVGNYIYDKDGVCAAMLLCEIAADLKKEGKNYGNRLNEIYQKYGTLKSRQIRINTLGGDDTARIMGGFRNIGRGAACGLKITDIKDYLYDKEMPYDLLVFEFEGGNAVAVRPSGTEPFIKVYMHAAGENYEDNFIKLSCFIGRGTKIF